LIEDNPAPRPGKMARMIETYPEYDGGNQFRDYRLFDVESLTQAVNIFAKAKLDGVCQ
jgi:hypothetical protein